MKKIKTISGNIEIENRQEVSNPQVAVPKSKLLSGSLDDKYPVILDDGKTIIYIADKSKEREILLRYGLQKKKKSFTSFSKSKLRFL